MVEYKATGRTHAIPLIKLNMIKSTETYNFEKIQLEQISATKTAFATKFRESYRWQLL